ncbi:sensor histidine kinase [Staphylococcus sp. SQ8-PEA]|uniref:histidine kinase n=1 Tax=Staphylococcus marylandisciuri TaxID=2981529 RepID=A0ABT2QMW1_9STAP|nr:sensor histidine kinase [Staphylococcus marylandisciuri]MCU5745302.1 sensor histidine kinase [Staphylococcus marylandisciuri]
MLNLFMLLLERMGLIILLAYILMNIPYFKNLMNRRSESHSKIKLIILFTFFSILSNFTGVQIRGGEVISGTLYQHLPPDASMANTRVLTIGVAGLIGGPYVALVVGVVSGLFRVYIGGADAYTYFISSVFIALLSGYFGYKALKSNRYPTAFKGAMVGVGSEVIQMLCILVFSHHPELSWNLFRFISIPMILINSIGTAIFMSIILSTIRHEEETRAIQTHDVLQLANATLPYFRSGLNEHSAKEAAEIILNLMQVSAVAITNRHDILTHVGAGNDHHVAQKAIITHLSKEAIHTNTLKEAYSREEIGCNNPHCPLEAAIVVPLHLNNSVAGTLKLYFTDKTIITTSDKQMASGLAEIFSSQLELGHAEMQSALLRDAEIKSLQAQVNPHFFFNAINTISAMIRINTEKARELLLQLSQFFRSNLQGARDNVITLEQELAQVNAYISLEQARYPNRFTIHFDIAPQAKQTSVPPFVLQILIENAIKHAFTHRRKNNVIQVNASFHAHYLRLNVTDNGHGIPPHLVQQLGKQQVTSYTGTGSALENLNKRLTGLFGTYSRLHFDSTDKGTSIYCDIPCLQHRNQEA